MQLKIKVSRTMDLESLGGQAIENSILRIPEKYREINRLSLGQFIGLRRRNGEIVTFQVVEAFVEDLYKDSNCAYVTTETHNDIFMVNRYVPYVEHISGITLGCDPESFLVDRINGRIVGAHRIIARKQGSVGHDGMLLELRPSPSEDPWQVVKNIAGLVPKARQLINMKSEPNRLAIVAGSSYNNVTAGFHLHFGIPKALLGFNKRVDRVARLMTRVFDYYVGIPSIIPEGDYDILRRTAPYMDYGKPGGFRLDLTTFEFRLPGGINMKSPELAHGLISLGLVVAEDVVSRISKCTNRLTDLEEIMSENDIKELYPNLPSANDFYPIICNPKIDMAKRHMKTIVNDVRNMIGYERNATVVEKYFNIVDHNEHISNDVEFQWRNV